MDTQITYIDLGFNASGLNTPVTPAFSSAGQNDAFLEEGSISNTKVRNISADKITAGTLTAVTNVGNDSIRLDGEDHSMKIYDSSNRLQIYIQGQ